MKDLFGKIARKFILTFYLLEMSLLISKFEKFSLHDWISFTISVVFFVMLWVAFDENDYNSGVK